MYRKAIVTSGSTRARLDSVRFLMNTSSGALGAALAEEGARRGWSIELLHGPFALLPKRGERWCGKIGLHEVSWIEELIPILERIASHGTVPMFFHAMAVLDFAPHELSDSKRPSGEAWTLTLQPTPKVIDRLRDLFPGVCLIAFKLEKGIDESELVHRATKLARRVDAELVVANLLEWVDRESYRCLIVDNAGHVRADISGRKRLAGYLWDHAAEVMENGSRSIDN